MPFKFSRSHQTSLRKCPREGLQRYWLDGTGYTRAGISIELGTGSLFHDTMGEVLQWILDHKQQSPKPSVIRQAVLNQRIEYETQMSVAVDEVLRLGLSGNVERAGWHKIIQRQATLAESMVRCWLIVRLPYFLANYELIAVEGEEETEIAPGLIFMQRKDSVWKHLESGSYHAMEFKTSGNNTENFVKSWQYDLQQITHLLNFRGKYKHDPTSVLLEIAYKGRKYQGEHVGALVSGYKQEIHTWDDEGSVAGYTTAEIEYDWVYGRCKTKGWEKFFICDEDFGNDNASPSEVWLNEILDFETLQDHCLFTEITHNPERIEKWLNQSRREMASVQAGLIQLDEIDVRGTHQGSEISPEELDKRRAEFEALADILFPALEEKDSCAPYFGSKACTFQSVCHGQDDMMDLHMTQGFKPRVSHHPGEFEEAKNNE